MNFGTGEGEGGTFALYQGLFPRPEVDEDEDGRHGRILTYHSHFSLEGGESVDSRMDRLKKHKWIKPLLLSWALFGSGCTLADGILTPAVSVVSAAEGLAVVKPELSSDIVPIAIAILIGLVLIQSFGIKKLSVAFSPSVALWLVFLFITGAVNVASHPGIWRACDPSRAVLYFVRTKNYDALGGVVLAITGTEALFGKWWIESRRSKCSQVLTISSPLGLLSSFSLSWNASKRCHPTSTLRHRLSFTDVGISWPRCKAHHWRRQSSPKHLLPIDPRWIWKSHLLDWIRPRHSRNHHCFSSHVVC